MSETTYTLGDGCRTVQQDEKNAAEAVVRQRKDARESMQPVVNLISSALLDATSGGGWDEGWDERVGETVVFVWNIGRSEPQVTLELQEGGVSLILTDYEGEIHSLQYADGMRSLMNNVAAALEPSIRKLYAAD